MMYKDIIIDHYRNPRNFGRLVNPSKRVTVYNPLCGDVITLEFIWKKNVLSDVSFTGEGCAISKASASLLTDFIKGKSREELRKLNEEVMINLIAIKISPGRIKCLFLPLEAVKKLIR